MKKYTKQEMDNLGIFLPSFSYQNNEIFTELNKLEIGEALFVKDTEWINLTNLNFQVNLWGLKVNKIFKCEPYEDGTFILRSTYR